MTQTLQILQLVLFSLPILALLILGGVILLKSVTIINRRWYLMIFLPLLLANTLAIFENAPGSEMGNALGWRLWLILIADIVMTIWVVLTFRGYLVFGLSADDTLELLTEHFLKEGLDVHLRTGKKRFLWGRTTDAQILTLNQIGQREELWITERFSEVLVGADSLAGSKHLRNVLGDLRRIPRPYDFKLHAVGVLYIVLGLVFAVLSWIFFFEPRLILIE